MADIREDVVFVDDDAGNDSLFDEAAGGSVAGAIGHEKLPGKLAEHAAGFWNRAKEGYEKGKAEHEHGDYHDYNVDEVAADGVTLQNVKVGAWERLATIPSTVAGVVGYRTTGTARPSAGVLVKEELVEVAVPKPRPIPELMHNATEEVSGLVRAEVALIKTEVQQKLKILAPAIGLIIVALALLLLALPFILWAAVFALAMVMPLWGAALVVFAVILLLAAGLAFAGVKMLKKVGNVKSLAGGSIKDDIHAIIEAFKGHKWADAQAAIKEGRL